MGSKKGGNTGDTLSETAIKIVFTLTRVLVMYQLFIHVHFKLMNQHL